MLQVGGSDQWGNITAGIDLIRRRTGQRGARVDLAAAHPGRRHEVRQDGQRRPVWLGAAATQPYRFYQYWMQLDDADVERSCCS